MMIYIYIYIYNVHKRWLWNYWNWEKNIIMDNRRPLLEFFHVVCTIIRRRSVKSCEWSIYVTWGTVKCQDISHHHHVALRARISLTFSLYPSLLSIALRKVFQAISCIDSELLYIGSSWSSNLCSSMRRGTQEYIAFELVLTSSAVSRMSGSSNLDSFRDGW